MFVSAGDRAGRKFPSLNYWIESFTLTTPNGVVPVVAFSTKTDLGNVAYADVDAAVVPFGRGAFTTSIADNTATGGNKRGQYSTDTQRQRALNTQVAGGRNSALIAGRNNAISGVVTNATYAGIFCGISNIIDTAGTPSSQGSVIVGGNTNTITDTAGGTSGAGIIAGEANTITVTNAQHGQFIGGGFTNSITGHYAAIVGGRQNNAAGNYTTVIGYLGRSRPCQGSFAHGVLTNGSPAGWAQYGRYVLFKQTTDNTSQVFTADNGAASATNQVGPIPSGYCFGFTGQVTCNKGSGTDTGFWTLSGVIKNLGGVLTLSSGTASNVFLDAGLATVTVTIAADAVNNCLQVKVTGLAATTLQWSCFVETCEIG